MGFDMTDGFHVHKVVWSPGKLVFSIDGKVTSTITSDVPSMPMYPIFDLALGAPGYRINATTSSPLRMEIDYIRVYAP
jgi:beta-glucanase (GH16 family)